MNQSITIKEVKDRSGYLQFVKFPFKLYKDNPYWIPPIIREEINTIDPKVNPVYQNAVAHFFLAYRNGKIVGRVAAIINWLEVKTLKKRKVRFGWYDTIDDINVSEALLEQVVNVGKAHGLNLVEGPAGFSSLDKTGLLTEGFQEQGSLNTLYNNPYYAEHLQKLGYKKLRQWIQYRIKPFTLGESAEKMKRLLSVIVQRYSLRILNFEKQTEVLPYVDKIFDLLNNTYSHLSEYVPVQKYQVEHYKKRYLQYLPPGFIKCIIDSNDDLIAFSIMMPSFSRALKKMNGKLYPFGFLHLLYALRFNNCAEGCLIGVRSDFQNRGVTAILFNEHGKFLEKHNFSTVETNPILEENLAAQQLWKRYNYRLHKKRATFSKVI